MGMTMSEKILARTSGRDALSPGEYVTARVDRVMCHEAFGMCLSMLKGLGTELHILESASIDDLEDVGGERIAEGIARLRRGQVRREAGYDGEYGAIRVFEPNEL